MCEAYREVDSDLKSLRRLLLDEGFWCLKDAADALYRSNAKPSAPQVRPSLLPSLIQQITEVFGDQCQGRC